MRLVITILVALHALLTGQAAHAAIDHAAWDGLLKRHVVELRGGQATQVDYAGFGAERSTLKHYLNRLSAVSRTEFDNLDRQEQLAFLINAYNAWTVELILTAYPDVTSIKELGSFFQSPWKKPFIPLLGETRPLDDIEHRLIRGSGRYNDPRIHFAVNCASIGCPALRAEAYSASRLDAQLEDAVRSFLSDRTRNRFDGGMLKVSSIFRWYRQDFEKGWRGANTLGQSLALYRQPLGLDDDTTSRLAANKIDIEFFDYDWRLNRKSGGKP